MAAAEAFHIGRCWRLAKEMADGCSGKRDVVAATPSCKRVSKAPRVTAEKRAEWQEMGRKEVVSDFEAVAKVVEKCEPFVVVMEQTSGLRGHRKGETLKEAMQAFACVPYRWEVGIFDCKAAGAAHRRKRLLILGIRDVENSC